MTPRRDLLPGTLDMLILKTLSLGRMHGWGISFHIRQTSGEVLQVNQGALYPALHRLEERGWVAAEWGTSENNRRARYYKVTAAGRAHLRAETKTWVEYAGTVTDILTAATDPGSASAP